MKTKLTIYLFILIGSLLFSCNKSKNSNVILTTTNYTASLTGANETPPDSSKAVGIAAFVFNPATRTLTGTVTYNGMNPTAGHIYKGAKGSAGSIVFSLGNPPFTSPIHFTSPALTQNQIYDLTSELFYINLLSADYPKGEIRGQLVKSSTGNNP